MYRSAMVNSIIFYAFFLMAQWCQQHQIAFWNKKAIMILEAVPIQSCTQQISTRGRRVWENGTQLGWNCLITSTWEWLGNAGHVDEHCFHTFSLWSKCILALRSSPFHWKFVGSVFLQHLRYSYRIVIGCPWPKGRSRTSSLSKAWLPDIATMSSQGMKPRNEANSGGRVEIKKVAHEIREANIMKIIRKLTPHIVNLQPARLFLCSQLLNDNKCWWSTLAKWMQKKYKKVTWMINSLSQQP